MLDNIKKSEEQLSGFWRRLGPGVITGAADDDPSGITTYSQAGAGFGYGLLWTAWLTWPLMYVVQEMCARLGIVTRKGLAANISKQYGRFWIGVISLLLLCANTLNIGADLGGMAAVTTLMFPSIDFYLAIFVFAVLILILEIYLSYKTYANILKWLAMFIFVYVIALGKVGFEWQMVMGLIPHIELNVKFFVILTAILGTTISPYLFFWQTSQEVEEAKANEHEKRLVHEELPKRKNEIAEMRKETLLGMFASNLVMLAIIAVSGATLFKSGVFELTSAEAAAASLKPLAGSFAYWLFSVGIVGTGLLAIPVLAGSSSYAIAEVFGFREGLNYKLNQAKAFYGVIIFSVLFGALCNALKLNPFSLMVTSAYVNGAVAPVIIIFVILLTNKNSVVGKFTNTLIQNAIGWSLVLFMAGSFILSFVV